MRNRVVGASPIRRSGLPAERISRFPAANDIEPGDRQRVDMSDAMAMGGSSSSSKRRTRWSEQITCGLPISSSKRPPSRLPGPTAFLAVPGIVAAVENQATMQRMLAALHCGTRPPCSVKPTRTVKRHTDFSYQFRGDTASTFK